MCSGFRHRVLVACVGSSGLENGVHDSAGNFHDSGAVVLSLSAVNGTEALQISRRTSEASGCKEQKFRLRVIASRSGSSSFRLGEASMKGLS